MAITLTSESLPARSSKQGSDVVTMSAAQELKIDAGGAELLKENVPAGKTWTVTISVHIIET